MFMRFFLSNHVIWLLNFNYLSPMFFNISNNIHKYFKINFITFFFFEILKYNITLKKILSCIWIYEWQRNGSETSHHHPNFAFFIYIFSYPCSKFKQDETK